MNAKERSSDKVGYKRPPKEHQFTKGRSGNPSGRPKKEKTEAGPRGVTAFDRALLAEAERKIAIRENDEVVEVTVAQAFVRTLAVTAIKGNVRAQCLLAELLRDANAADAENTRYILLTAYQLRQELWDILTDAEARGAEPPELVPHPDEIVVDFSACEVRYNGPTSIEEKRLWDSLTAHKADADETIREYERALVEDPEGAAALEDDVEFARETIFRCEALVPDVKLRRRPGFDLRRWREERKPIVDPMLRELEQKRRVAVARRRRELEGLRPITGSK